MSTRRLALSSHTARHTARVTLVAATVAAALITPLQAASPTPPVLQWSAPATGVVEVVVEAGNGEVTVVPSADDQVRVEVRTRLKRWSDDEPWRRLAGWFLSSRYEEDEALLASLRIDHRRSGDLLELTLLPRGRTRTNRVEESWRVEVPATAKVDVQLDSGDLEVTGVGGGVRAELGAGDLLVRVPQGDLDLRVGVGEIEASLASRSTARVALESTVGDARLWVGGSRIEHAREPGPGNHVSLSGSGRYAVRASVDVGDVSVRVGG
jgi:hypothetical protein